MTTLSANSPREYDDSVEPLFGSFAVVASDIIYEGAVVGESSSTGTARPLSDGDAFLGFAERKVDNLSGSAGDKNATVRQQGIVTLDVTGVASDADLGAAVYCTDDDTFSLTDSGADTQIGKVVEWISSTKCKVFFQGYIVRSI